MQFSLKTALITSLIAHGAVFTLPMSSNLGFSDQSSVVESSTLEVSLVKKQVIAETGSKQVVEEVIEQKAAPKAQAKMGIPIPSTAPQILRRARRYPGQETGLKAVVSVKILSSGRVGDVEIVDSSGNEKFDKWARLSIKKWRFKPKTVNGVAVDSIYELPITVGAS